MTGQTTGITLTSNRMPVTADTTIGAFNRLAVVERSRNLYEPKWMRDKRLEAYSLSEDLPMPTIQDEAWRRTNLQDLDWQILRLPDTASISSFASLKDVPGETQMTLDVEQDVAGRLVLLNGRVAWREMDETLAELGVIFTDMATAVREYPYLVEQYFMTAGVVSNESKITALHGALWDSGVFIYVPAQVEVKRPFHVVIGLEGENSAVFPHILVVAEKASKLTLVEESMSLDTAQQALLNGVSEVFVGDDARVTYVDVQRLGNHVFNFNTKRAIHRPNSRLTWDVAQLGSRLTKTFVDNLLKGNGASAEFNGIYLAGEGQHIDLDLLSHHIGLGTQGDLLIKGAAQGNGRAVLRGMIKIAPGAQHTDSYLKNDNLLLGKNARVDTIPGLEIDADDVRASHGATVSRIDEEHTFYLQSRGIPRKQALRMVVESFFGGVFDRMSQPYVRDRLAAAVSEKIGD